MKGPSMFNRWTLLFVLMLPLVALATPPQVNQVFLEPCGTVSTNPLDDPEPDTLYYDDDLNQSFYFSALTNYWTMVRFIPPANFDLHSIYFALGNPGGNATACSVFVHLRQADNRPGTLLHQALASPQTGSLWYDVTLDSNVHFNANQEFMIVIGRAPGVPNGWWPFLDGGTTVNRSYYTTTSRTGNFTAIPYDLRIRAGGSFEQFVDISSIECFNAVDGGAGMFNMPVGSSVLMKTLVQNVANADVAEFTAFWEVAGPGGGIVFENEIVGTAVDAGETVEFEADQSFTVNTPGEYIASCVVNADNDASALNDTSYLRFFVGGEPRWYRYDDNQDAEGNVFFGAGSGTGVSFKPGTYTAEIESIRVFVGADDTGDLRIYMNDEDGMPTGQPVWDNTPPCVAGWNTFPVSPHVFVYEGQSFTAAYFYTVAGLGRDGNVPNAASITSMGTVSWQTGDGAAWEADLTGNWSIQVKIDTSSAQPPFPIIDASIDTFRFGQVDTTGNTSVTVRCWFYNRGGQDPLNVTSFVFNPPAIRTAFTTAPTSVTVAASDSEYVDFVFNPVAVRFYNGRVTANNNSENDATWEIPVYAEGIQAQAAGDAEVSLPTEFSLAQNFPNPFNPSTEIEFALPVASNIRLTVYNVLGEQTAVIAAGSYPAGTHNVTFDASTLSAGVYFYRLEAGDFTTIRKMMLLK